MSRRNGYYNDTTVGEYIAKLFINLLATLINVLWLGFVTKTIWNWFIPVLFDGMPRLGTAGAIGISILVGVLTMRTPNPDENENYSATELAFFQTIYVLLTGTFMLAIAIIAQASL